VEIPDLNMYAPNVRESDYIKKIKTGDSKMAARGRKQKASLL
jgi:hypothetical protein